MATLPTGPAVVRVEETALVSRQATHAPRGTPRDERLMWITSQRVFYAGLLGAVAERSIGAHGIYLSPVGAALRIRIEGGDWQRGELMVVPPLVPHQIETEHRSIISLLIESEFVDPARLPEFLQHRGPVDAPAFIRQARDAHALLAAASGRQSFDRFDFDTLFFGAPLAARPLDARIREVVGCLNADPAMSASAEQCAASVGLSFSRFLHLFKQETGLTFRAFRAWKRARSLLRHVRQSTTLTDIALDTGYPDSTHFSHSIRQVYGLRPSDILAGSRRLAVHQ